MVEPKAGIFLCRATNNKVSFAFEAKSYKILRTKVTRLLHLEIFNEQLFGTLVLNVLTSAENDQAGYDVHKLCNRVVQTRECEVMPLVNPSYSRTQHVIHLSQNVSAAW